MLAEVGHANVFEIALVDHVMGGNGVTEKHIRLVEGHCIQGILIRRVGADDRLGVQLFHLIERQVVIDKAQAQPVEAFAEAAGFSLARDQHRLVHGIGFGEDKVRRCSFKPVGGAQQVNFPGFQGTNGCRPGRVAHHSDGQGECLGQQARVIGGKAFIIMAAGSEVKGRVVRGGCTQR